MEQNNTVVHENIAGTAGRYRWTRYLNIRVIEDTTNGYINATKMCAMYGKTKNGKEKQFRKWKYSNEHFIQLVSSSVLRTPDELVPCAVTGGQIEIIRGTYVHRDLAVKLASWCSDEFGYMVSKIINSHIETENRMLREQKDSLLLRIDELMKKTDSVVEEMKNANKKSDAMKIQNDEIKAQSDAMKIQNDEIKAQSDAMKIQNDEIKAQSDAMKIQNDEMKAQSDGLQSSLNKVFCAVTSIQDQVVYKAENPKVKELMVLMYSAEQDYYVVLRTQERNKKQAMKNCKNHYGNEFEEVFNVIAYQNPRNLLHRFKDHVNANPDLKRKVKFHKTMFQTDFDIDVIKTILFELEKTFQDTISEL